MQITLKQFIQNRISDTFVELAILPYCMVLLCIYSERLDSDFLQPEGTISLLLCYHYSLNHRSSLLDAYFSTFRSFIKCVLVLSTAFNRIEINHDTRRHTYFRCCKMLKNKTFLQLLEICKAWKSLHRNSWGVGQRQSLRTLALPTLQGNSNTPPAIPTRS